MVAKVGAISRSMNDGNVGGYVHHLAEYLMKVFWIRHCKKYTLDVEQCADNAKLSEGGCTLRVVKAKLMPLVKYKATYL
jgi:hypothetical protein